MDDDEDAPLWDQDFAADLVGQTILIGITYVDAADNALEQEQLHGTIARVGRGGIVVDLEGVHDGETKELPPALDWIEIADPGTYTLRSTGEVLIDPDLIVTYTVRRPDN